jgi:hypothetical protein
MSTSLSIPALGRQESLGAFYDARTDTFVAGLNLFKNHRSLKEDEDMQTTDDTKTTTRVSKTDSFEEKCNLMDIKGQLKLSIALGLVNDVQILGAKGLQILNH